MIEDKIREVMGLVRQYGDANYMEAAEDSRYNVITSGRLRVEQGKLYSAIESKLRELLEEKQ